MARVFVAVELPAVGAAALHDALVPLRASHPDLRWAHPTRWHVTLVFLGDLSAAEQQRSRQALRRAAGGARPCTVMVSGRVGSFGRRVLWAAVEPCDGAAGDRDPLGALAGTVRAELTRAQVAFDDRPFQAHLTVARTRRGTALPRPGQITAPGLPFRWVIHTVALLSSEPAQHGGGYRTIATWPLDEAAPGT